VTRAQAGVDFAKSMGWVKEETAKLMTMPPPPSDVVPTVADDAKIEELHDGEYLITYSHPFKLPSKFFAHAQQ
jgi:hypothetical protein